MAGAAAASKRHGSKKTPQIQEAEDEEYVFETFHHNNGHNYVCMSYKGKRYYLDSWDSHEWHPFPAHWKKQGCLVKTDREQAAAEYYRANSTGTETKTRNSTSKRSDREGTFSHPTKGLLSTYFIEEKRNILYFYDKTIRMWVKVPAAWEVEADFIRPLISNIQKVTPEWRDEMDIVAALRQSSYDPDDTVATLTTIGLRDPLILAKAKGTNVDQSKSLKEQAARISSLETQLRQKDEELEAVRTEKEEWKRKCEGLQEELKRFRETVTKLEVQKKTSEFHVEGLKREKTMMMQREKTLLQITPRPPAGLPLEPVIPEGPTLDEETIAYMQKLSETIKRLDHQHLQLKEYVGKRLSEVGEMNAEIARGFQQLKGGKEDLNQEVQELRGLYRKEMMVRKMLYNQLQELRGNIRVFLRCKPDSEVSLELNGDSATVMNLQGRKQTFEFDKVYDGDTMQETIFDNTKPVITSCIDGYNVCILAYGQTGSGKTYTMMGTEKKPGVNIRAVTELLKVASEKEQIEYRFKLSLFEVYNETVNDLIPKDKNGTNLNVRMLGKHVEVEGANEIEISSLENVKQIIDLAEKNRKIAQTNMNTNSSRSHLLLKLKVEGTDRVTGQISLGTLTLVDLAGSEKVAKTGATGQTLVEAAAINKSLSALSHVFASLKDKSLHIPYRNSKLTQLLQPSLGGEAKACMFVNVSTLETNLPETITSLNFGSNARQVELGKVSRNLMPEPAQFN